MALVGVAVVVISSDRSGDGKASMVHSEIESTPRSKAPHALTLRQAKAAHYRVYTSLRNPGTELPPAVLSHLRQIPMSRLSMDIEHAHLLRTELGALWVVIGDETTCLVQAGDGALSCFPTATALHTGVTLGTSDSGARPSSPHRFLSLGIAPDWVKTVRMRVGNSIHVVPVVRNSYAAQANVPVLVQAMCGAGGLHCTRPMLRY